MAFGLPKLMGISPAPGRSAPGRMSVWLAERNRRMTKLIPGWFSLPARKAVLIHLYLTCIAEFALCREALGRPTDGTTRSGRQLEVRVAQEEFQSLALSLQADFNGGQTGPVLFHGVAVFKCALGCVELCLFHLGPFLQGQ